MGGGLINFLPLKRGGLIEDLWSKAFTISLYFQTNLHLQQVCLFLVLFV